MTLAVYHGRKTTTFGWASSSKKENGVSQKYEKVPVFLKISEIKTDRKKMSSRPGCTVKNLKSTSSIHV